MSGAKLVKLGTWSLLLALATLASSGCASAPASGAAERSSQDAAPAPAEPLSEGELSSDPYRKVPRGEPVEEVEPGASAARFVPPSADPSPSEHPLALPARLAVAFVHGGRFVSGGAELLRLESSLADVTDLRDVLALALPRGRPRDLSALGEEARAARFDLLLVLELPRGAAYVVRSDGRAKHATFLARFEAPSPEGPLPPASHGSTPLEGILRRLRGAHAELCRAE